MEFTYNKMTLIKYLLFTFVWVGVIAVAAMFFPVLNVVALVAIVIALWFAFGTFARVFELLTKIFIVDHTGIHFYEGGKEKAFLPWESVEDFAASKSQVVIRANKQLHRISSELARFDEFKDVIAQQIVLPANYRGLNLPRLNRPKGLGGKPDYSQVTDEHLKNLAQEQAKLIDPTYQGERLEILGGEKDGLFSGDVTSESQYGKDRQASLRDSDTSDTPYLGS